MATEILDAIASFKSNVELVKQFLHGDAETDVFLENGTVPTLSKLVASVENETLGQKVQRSQRFTTGRKPSPVAGIFLNNGNVSVELNGLAAALGDFLTHFRYEAQTVANGGKSGIFLTQKDDPVFAAGTTGSAITASNSQTFGTGGATITANANQLADRVFSYLYTPAGLAPMWATTRIVSHGPLSGNSATFVLEDPPDEGSAPTSWIVHGKLAQRILAPNVPAGANELPLNIEATAGGFTLWIGSGIVLAEFFGQGNRV